MKMSEQQSRINLAELKTQIVKKVGVERSKQYFYYMNRFFSQRLTKEEFDKLCFRILGRENLPLHNQLIRSILQNVSHAKVPPPIDRQEGPPKSITAVSGNNGLSPSEDGRNNHIGRRSPIPIQASGVPTPPIWSNGDMLPISSPRKGRSGIRDRKLKDRPSPLGPNGKMDINSHQLNAPDGSVKVSFTENGELRSCDLQRPMQQHQGHAQQPENGHDVSLHCSTTRPEVTKSMVGPVYVHSNGPIDGAVIENRGHVEQAGGSESTRSPLRAPLGIPFCSASLGGTRRIQSAANRNSFIGCLHNGELHDTETLNKRMSQIAEAQGLEGVSANCTNLMNNGLDLYLKRLIRSCVDLVGTRSGHGLPKQPFYKPQPHGKLINGFRPGHQLQMQSSSGALEGIQDSKRSSPISLLDFKAAMELNPQQLGEDWPVLLEKICMHACEE